MIYTMLLSIFGNVKKKSRAQKNKRRIGVPLIRSGSSEDRSVIRSHHNGDGKALCTVSGKIFLTPDSVIFRKAESADEGKVKFIGDNRSLSCKSASLLLLFPLPGLFTLFYAKLSDSREHTMCFRSSVKP